MRVSIPITITKAGAPVTPHLIIQRLGTSDPVDVLGIMKENGSTALLKIENAAIVVNQNETVTCTVDYENEQFVFGELNDLVYEQFQDQYDWIGLNLRFEFSDFDNIASSIFKLEDAETRENLLVAYDICGSTEENTIMLPLDVFVPEIDVDPGTAFVTTIEEVDGTYLALSVNGIVRPIYDVGGNEGCPVAADGGTFNVSNCSDVRAAGVGMSELPLQAALGTPWRTRSCSVDDVLITTSLAIAVHMLGYDFSIDSESITDTAGMWYIQPSKFTVVEA